LRRYDLEVVEGEFDFTAEAAKIGEFTALFQQHGLADRIMVPTVVEELSTECVMVGLYTLTQF
jgi:predicted unusual protein kinase regulating ubiquinone biosynthesis (AarF/ABC1/UbiB family)